MSSLLVSLDEDTMLRLRVIVSETGIGPERLAENAVAEAALHYFRHRSDDQASRNFR